MTSKPHRSHNMIGTFGKRERTEEHTEVFVLVRRHYPTRYYKLYMQPTDGIFRTF